MLGYDSWSRGLRLANFHRRFLEGYAKRTVAMTDLLKGNHRHCLKKAAIVYTSERVHLGRATHAPLRSEAADFPRCRYIAVCLAGILPQLCEDQNWHHVVFASISKCGTEVGRLTLPLALKGS